MQTKYATWTTIGLLLIAMVPALPYGYYNIMRWVVCACCAWLAVAANRKLLVGWALVWAAVAAIYNPIIPVRASREIWTIANLATIGVVLAFRKHDSLSQGSKQ